MSNNYENRKSNFTDALGSVQHPDCGCVGVERRGSAFGSGTFCLVASPYSWNLRSFLAAPCREMGYSNKETGR